MSGHTVVVRKRIPVSREEVYDAWLDAEGMSQWMCPGPVAASEVTIDPRVGGRFRIIMKGGAESFDHTGAFVTLERPSRLQFTWQSKGTENEETLVTIDLTMVGGECDLVLTHERFPTGMSAAQHQDGWIQIADKLADHVVAKRRERPDFVLTYDYSAPVTKLYEQFASKEGIQNWWTVLCEMDARVGGSASEPPIG